MEVVSGRMGCHRCRARPAVASSCRLRLVWSKNLSRAPGSAAKVAPHPACCKTNCGITATWKVFQWLIHSSSSLLYRASIYSGKVQQALLYIFLQILTAESSLGVGLAIFSCSFQSLGVSNWLTGCRI